LAPKGAVRIGGSAKRHGEIASGHSELAPKRGREVAVACSNHARERPRSVPRAPRHALERGAKPEPVPVARDEVPCEGPKDSARMERRKRRPPLRSIRAQRFLRSAAQERAKRHRQSSGARGPGSVPGRTSSSTASSGRDVSTRAKAVSSTSEEVRILSGRAGEEEALRSRLSGSSGPTNNRNGASGKSTTWGSWRDSASHEGRRTGTRSRCRGSPMPQGWPGAVRLVLSKKTRIPLDHRAMRPDKPEERPDAGSDHVRRLALLGSETGSAREASDTVVGNGFADESQSMASIEGRAPPKGSSSRVSPVSAPMPL